MRSIRHLVQTVLILIMNLPSFGQFDKKDSIVYLKYEKLKDVFNGPLLYSKYKVFDNRIDSSPFISTVIAHGGTPLKLRFETNAPADIENYIARITAGRAQGDRQLIISLKRYIMLGRHAFYFTADAWERRSDSGYFRVCTLDSAFQKQPADFAAGKAIALLVAKANNLVANAGNAGSRSRTLQEIADDKVNKSWDLFPILHDTDEQTGIYMNFNRMQNNQVEKINLRLSLGEDSAYRISTEETSDSSKKKLVQWARNPLALLKYQGTMYIRWYQPIIPMTVRNHAIYLHLPEGYPDFFSFELWRMANANYGGNTYVATTRDILNSFVAKAITNPILKDGAKSKVCRDAYLDVEKLIVVYY